MFDVLQDRHESPMGREAAAAVDPLADPLQNDGLSDPLMAPSAGAPSVAAAAGELPPGEPAHHAPVYISDEQRSYNQRQRDSKKRQSMQVETEEKWSSSGTKSARKVARMGGDKDTATEHAAFGSSMTETETGSGLGGMDYAKGAAETGRVVGKGLRKLGKKGVSALRNTAVGRTVVNEGAAAWESTKESVGELKDGATSAAHKVKGGAASAGQKIKDTFKRKGSEQPGGDVGASDDDDARALLEEWEEADDATSPARKKALASKRKKKEKAAKKKASGQQNAQTRKEGIEKSVEKTKSKKAKKAKKETDREAAYAKKVDAAEEWKKTEKPTKWKDRDAREHQRVLDGSAKKKTLKEKANRLGLNTQTFGFSRLGDESGVDIGDFNQDRSGENWQGGQVETVEETYEGADKSKHTVNRSSAKAGKSTGGNLYERKVNGSAVTESGIHGSAFAGTKLDASTDAYTTKDSAGIRASTSAQAGIGARGGLGSRTTNEIGGGFGTVAEAGAEGETFIGLEAEAASEVVAKKGMAKASTSGKMALGGRISGKAGANTALKIGGNELVGARAKADGEAFAGLKAEGGADAKISAMGVEVNARGEAMAGAEAEGKASAGVTAGFVDVDAAAEGKAFAGAKAGAEGGAKFGPLGGEVGGKAEAFAGAKVEGEIGAEFGACGLNLGKVVVRGKAQAGAGGNIGFKFAAMAGQLEGGAEAGAAVGVGIGAGMQLQGDLLFPVRLIIDQVAKNGVKLATDTGRASAEGAQWNICPTLGAAAMPAVEDLPSDGISAASPSADVDAGLPDGVELPTGLAGKSGLAAAMPSLTPTVANLVQNSRDQANNDVDGAFSDVSKSASATMARALTIMGQVGPAIVEKLFDAEAAYERAQAAIDGLIEAGQNEAAALMGTLGQVAGDALGKLTGLLTTPIWDLLSVDFMTLVDAVIIEVYMIINQIRAAILEVIARTEDLIIAAGTELGKVVMDPILFVADSVGAVVGQFGTEMTTSGSDIVDTLEGSLGAPETGIAIPGVAAELVLPQKMSPKLKPAKGVMGDAQSFFTGAATGAFGKVLSDLAEPVIHGAFVEAPLKITQLGRESVAEFDKAQKNVGQPIEDGVRTVASDVAPAIDGLRDFLADVFGWERVEPAPRPEIPKLSDGKPASPVTTAPAPALGAGAGAAAAAPVAPADTKRRGGADVSV